MQTFFFRIFFIKEMILIMQKYLFWSYSSRRKIKYSDLGLNKGRLSNLLLAKKGKAFEFYKRMFDEKRKDSFF